MLLKSMRSNDLADCVSLFLGHGFAYVLGFGECEMRVSSLEILQVFAGHREPNWLVSPCMVILHLRFTCRVPMPGRPGIIQEFLKRSYNLNFLHPTK